MRQERFLSRKSLAVLLVVFWRMRPTCTKNIFAAEVLVGHSRYFVKSALSVTLAVTCRLSALHLMDRYSHSIC